jgi:FtsH-binding integral membrane protein
MSDVKLQAFWFLMISLVGVIMAAAYIAYTGRRLKNKKGARTGDELMSHKVAVSLFFPFALAIALTAVTRLIPISGGRHSPELLYTMHMVFVFVFVWAYSLTWYKNGLKDATHHHELAHRAGWLFLAVTALGMWVGSYNPVIREGFELMFS